MTEPVTLINVFEVPADQVDAFAEQWRERGDVMIGAPGFLDARLHRAISADTRFQLVNVARWESIEAWRAAVANPEFRARIAELEKSGFTFTANPALYREIVDL